MHVFHCTFDFQLFLQTMLFLTKTHPISVSKTDKVQTVHRFNILGPWICDVVTKMAF